MTSPRQKAWRNLLVLAINTAIARKVFKLANNNTFVIVDEQGNPIENGFEFSLPDGARAYARCQDVLGGVCVAALVNADDELRNVDRHNISALIRCGWHADGFALGELEFDPGFRLRKTAAHFKRAMKHYLAGLKVEPEGYEV